MLETIQRWQSTNDPRFMEFGQFLAHSHRISRASRQATLADETP
jgi:hypothetical protein